MCVCVCVCIELGLPGYTVSKPRFALGEPPGFYRDKAACDIFPPPPAAAAARTVVVRETSLWE